ncbi:carbamoyltransferase family protein [Paenibacillus sambharensis]|nr:carbamoyltransferase C-terminal domain-containing protein [Paenibacillus sambharensis]
MKLLPKTSSASSLCGTGGDYGMTIVLGLGGSGHSYAACLVKDGIVKAAIEEERLSKVRHCLFVPGTENIRLARSRAVLYCLEAAGVGPDEVDLVISNDIMHPLYCAKYNGDAIAINHHLAHAAASYYTSPFRSAAVWIADGSGSFLEDGAYETASYYEADEDGLRLLQRTAGRSERRMITDHDDLNHSIGGFYRWVTEAIGFGFLQDGKTMGLAPYGTPRYVEQFAEYYTFTEDGHFIQTKEQVQRFCRWLTLSLQEVSGEREQFERRADLAFAAQHHLEQVVIQSCRYLFERTGRKQLCLGGGIAFNSTANGKILRDTRFEELYLFPAAGDAGTAAGSALYGYHVLKAESRSPAGRPFSPFLGKAYADSDILKACARYKDRITVTRPEKLTDTAAQWLSSGRIIGWYQGRSEFGPRALGNRSLLADARNPGMRDTINLTVKHRESFRPFGAVVLEDEREAYFEGQDESHYMMKVYKVKRDKAAVIPAVVHTDGTCRLQTATEQTAPLLHELLLAFAAITGVPVLLNTSLNDHGMPMAESPDDALDTFMNTAVDALAIGPYWVTKTGREKDGAANYRRTE